MTLFQITLPSRLSREQQATWWKPLATVFNPLIIETVYIDGKMLQLADIPDNATRVFYQTAFEELFGEWLPERQTGVVRQPQWSSTWILMATPHAQSLDALLQQTLAHGYVRTWWFAHWKCVQECSASAEVMATLKPQIEAAGWRVIRSTPHLPRGVFRVLARSVSFLPYLSALSADQVARPVSPPAPSTFLPIDRGDAHPTPVADDQKTGDFGAVLAHPDEPLGFSLGVTLLGERVRLAWKPMTIHVYGTDQLLVAFLIMLFERTILEGNTDAMPFVGIVPPQFRDLLQAPAIRHRVRILDGADLFQSAALPLNFLPQETLNAVADRHGIERRGTNVPTDTSLATYLRQHQGERLITKTVLGLTAPQSVGDEQDEILAVLRQGGGVVLIGDDTYETRFLADLLWELIAYAVPDAPLCCVAHAGIPIAPALRSCGYHFVINPDRITAGQTHAELRAAGDHWLFHDYQGQDRTLDADLDAASTDQTADVVEQLLAAFQDVQSPVRRTPITQTSSYITAIDAALNAVANDDSLPTHIRAVAYKSAQQENLPTTVAVTSTTVAPVQNGQSHATASNDVVAVPKPHTVLAQPIFWRGILRPYLESLAIGGMQHQQWADPLSLLMHERFWLQHSLEDFMTIFDGQTLRFFLEAHVVGDEAAMNRYTHVLMTDPAARATTPLPMSNGNTGHDLGATETIAPVKKSRTIRGGLRG